MHGCLAHVLLVVFLTSSCAEDLRSVRSTEQRIVLSTEQPALKVMTYHVDFGPAIDWQSVIEAIESAGADIVLLQSTSPAWERWLRAGLSDRYAFMGFQHWKGDEEGLAILSRHPFEHRELIAPPPGCFHPAWLVEIRGSAIGDLELMNVHLHPALVVDADPSGNLLDNADLRLAEVQSYFARLSPDAPALIGGEFNEPGTGKALRHIAKQGFQSALFEVDPTLATWSRAYFSGIAAEQLDHLVTSRHLVPNHVEAVSMGMTLHKAVVGLFVTSH